MPGDEKPWPERQSPDRGEPDVAFARMNRVGQALLTHCPLAELFDKIARLVAEVVEADRAAVLLATAVEEGDTGSDEEPTEHADVSADLAVKALFDAQGPSPGQIRMSRSIARQVIEEKQAVLVIDAQSDQRFSTRQSVILQDIRSAICVPLWSEEQVCGLLYADRHSLTETFAIADLHLLILVGHLAAVKIRETHAQEELRRREQIAEDLERAASIQRQFLPATDWVRAWGSLSGCHIPCFGVGGDYFDYFERASGKLFLALGDVCGKGMAAALLMASVHAQLRALASTNLELVEIATQVNRLMFESVRGKRFITLFFGDYDPATGELRFVNAGHNPPLLRRLDQRLETLDSTGLLLGAFPLAPQEVDRVTLNPGDRLLVYTDGITEAGMNQDREFGDEGLREFCRVHAELAGRAFVDQLVQSVQEFTGPDPPSDDITVLELVRIA